MAHNYIGRIAPSPTGYLHLGHARTFWFAMERANSEEGILIYREEDLDYNRCRKEYSQAAIEDLRWFGCVWQKGPDKSEMKQSYRQSERMPLFLKAWEDLKEQGLIYPCEKSRKDIHKASENIQNIDLEPIYPEAWRPKHNVTDKIDSPEGYNWRYKVPQDRKINFHDENLGPCQFSSGKDFGDFLVWRKDGIPSYELAVVVDDIAMEITEVVRGEDLLISTARQILIYEALGAKSPQFFHAPLVVDSSGDRLAKAYKSMSLRELKKAGFCPEDLRKSEAWWSGLEDSFES